MLNTSHFTLLAGNPSKWDEETLRLCKPGRYEGTYDSADLCKVQVDQHRRGRRSATPVKTMYGWTVRLASGLDERQILCKVETREEAIAWGKAWANEDPENREFYAAAKDLA